MNPPKDMKLIQTEDGSLTMLDSEFGETFHSSSGAALESKALYIEGSQFTTFLNSDTSQSISVLDIGLGLGYNALSTIEAWSDHGSPQDLRLVSLEFNPSLPIALASANAPWMVGWSEVWRQNAKQLTPNTNATCYTGHIQHPKGPSRCDWTIIVGDALALELDTIRGDGFDFFWQDAFSPTKNPKLWTTAWFKKLANIGNPGARLMSFSVARNVREALAYAGFEVHRIKALGRKRNWLIAELAISEIQ